MTNLGSYTSLDHGSVYWLIGHKFTSSEYKTPNDTRTIEVYCSPFGLHYLEPFSLFYRKLLHLSVDSLILSSMSKIRNSSFVQPRSDELIFARTSATRCCQWASGHTWHIQDFKDLFVNLRPPMSVEDHDKIYLKINFDHHWHYQTLGLLVNPRPSDRSSVQDWNAICCH